MPSEKIGDYEIEFTGVAMPDGDGWAAHLTIVGPSPNPMHRNITFTEQRVAVETVFPDAAAAEAEARRIGVEMLEAPAPTNGAP
ncbi:hypothetical protein RCH09_000264 [Actimicrobium sp. GrIS 1.19]|uniref:hypothetical protein n=1 Tax=Actimicrobium sp. GrIS 1.19 TaxID=3071708 RepID=UPI002E046C9C|nr:hypothetical protein [Actimicrobium sp. GrIS 1.19]